MKTTQHIFLLAFVSMVAAWYNGYPLIYSDSGTYIGSGFLNEMPLDRPIFYGWWIVLTSLCLSLWWVILAQNLLLSWTFLRLAKAYGMDSFRWIFFLWVVLQMCTAASWYSCQIMPDIFTPILGMLLMIHFKESTVSWWDLPLIILCILMHSSHFPVLLLLVLLAFVLREKWLIDTQIIARWSMALGLAIIIALATSYSFQNKLQLAPGSSLFIMGSLLDAGVLEEGLADYCQDHQSDLCALKENFPENSRALLWTSPVAFSKEIEQRSAHSRGLVLTTLLHPGRCLRWIHHSLLSSVSMLCQNSVGSGLISEWYRSPDSPPHVRVQQFFPQEIHAYRNSRQNGNLWGQELELNLLNRLQNPLLVTSLLFLLMTWKTIHPSDRKNILFLLAAIVIHAAVVASLANVYDRLQSRLSWLLILVGLFIVIKKHFTTLEPTSNTGL